MWEHFIGYYQPDMCGTEKVYKLVKDQIFCICGPCICMLYAPYVFNFPYVF